MFQKHAQWSQAGEVAKRLKPRLPAPPMAGTWTQILRLTCVSQRAVPICQSYFVLYNSASHFVKLRVAAGPLTEEELKAMLPGQHKFEFNFLETNVRSFFCFFCFTFRICRSCFATFPSRGRAHSCSASRVGTSAISVQKRIVESFFNDVFSIAFERRETRGLWTISALTFGRRSWRLPKALQ